MTVTGLTAAVLLKLRAPDRDQLMAARLLELAPTVDADRISCMALSSQRPVVLLVLGQSNAGNHGQPANGAKSAGAVQVMHAGICSHSADPLPGATGQAASLWSMLPGRLVESGVKRPVLLQILAVDASRLDDWIRTQAPINRHLTQTLRANQAAGVTPDLVLWQQGEADAMAGTPPAMYTKGLQTLAMQLAASGIQAPIVVARSTVCRSEPHAGLRAAIQLLEAEDSRFLPGPDTDSIRERFDGCHFSAAGRQQAAALWAALIAGLPGVAD